jgi:hypothetical protein
VEEKALSNGWASLGLEFCATAESKPSLKLATTGLPKQEI